MLEINSNFLLAFILLLSLGCSDIKRPPGVISEEVSRERRLNARKNFDVIVEKGFLEIGMTKQQVETVMGQPFKVIHKNNNKYDEIWIYRSHWKFKDLVYLKQGILVDTSRKALIYSNRTDMF